MAPTSFSSSCKTYKRLGGGGKGQTKHHSNEA
nr:MAG TPA: hypothetical protein [Caudoviricetes sp.]